MKQFKLIVKSICSLLLLWMLFSVPAYSRASVTGNIQDDGQDYVGRIVVVTDLFSTPATHCGDSFADYKCVIINPGGGRARVTVIGVDPNHDIKPGDRFNVTAQVECDDRLDLTLEPK